MKAKKRYRITIEDESRLRQIASVSAPPYILWIGGVAAVIILIVLTALLIIATPVRTLMPGYLKKGERTVAEEGLLRLDSLRDSYMLNNMYLNNILTVFDTDRTPPDTAQMSGILNELPPDSLLPASPREIQFITQLKDREQYNVAILAPLAADQLKIYPVGASATIDEKTRNALKAKILTPKGSPVCAIADGRVLSVQNPAPEGGSAIVIQHDSGFASRYSHVGTPAVAQGSHVEGGSVIAHGGSGGHMSPGTFYMEMWYDGTPVEPGRYLIND
ncbi:MAG: M23 family metallopeptidase [Muribaculaceae bacterium]|nr:M23 family metallopeptidase [Muribaculaceae bacterium]